MPCAAHQKRGFSCCVHVVGPDVPRGLSRFSGGRCVSQTVPADLRVLASSVVSPLLTLRLLPGRGPLWERLGQRSPELGVAEARTLGRPVDGPVLERVNSDLSVGFRDQCQGIRCGCHSRGTVASSGEQDSEAGARGGYRTRGCPHPYLQHDLSRLVCLFARSQQPSPRTQSILSPFHKVRFLLKTGMSWVRHR